MISSFSMTTFLRVLGPLLPLILLHTAYGQQATGQPADQVTVRWGQDSSTLGFAFRDLRREYPADLLKGTFPSAGVRPEYRFQKDWPVVTMTARWSAAVKDWPPAYRPRALDLMLMYACDAQLYEHIFPEFITESQFTVPPEFLEEAGDPEHYHLAEHMRGKIARYEITAKAGFAAKDYQIKTKIRIGGSADGKTIFYHDDPDYISDHLTDRQFVLAAHDAGDAIHFEVIMVCICSPRKLFRGETMKRVEDNGRYYVGRLYERLHLAPTVQEIEEYLGLVKQGARGLK